MNQLHNPAEHPWVLTLGVTAPDPLPWRWPRLRSAGRWECPWHDCSVCGAPAASLCDFCPRSFCRDHEAGAFAAASVEGRLCCSSHNPLSPLGPNSSSTQLHHSALSPTRVKEEPETDLGEQAAEWHRSFLNTSFLADCSLDPRQIWNSALQKVTPCFLTSAAAAIPSQDTSLNTAERLAVLAEESEQASLYAVFSPLLPPGTTSDALLSPPAPVRGHKPPPHLVSFFNLFCFLRVVMSSVTGTLRNPMSEAEGE